MRGFEGENGVLIFYGCICRLSCFWHSVRGIVFNHSTMFSRPHLMVIVFFSINRYQPVDLVLLRRKNRALVSQVLRVQYNYVLLSKSRISKLVKKYNPQAIQDSSNLRQEAPSKQSPPWFHLQRLNFRGPSLHILTARGAPGREFTGQWRMDYASMGFWDQRRLPSPHTSNCFIIPATPHSPS